MAYGGWWWSGDSVFTLTAWGTWVEFDFYVPEIGETVTDEVFFIGGAFEGPFEAHRFDLDDDDLIVTTYVTGEFRGVTDEYGRE